MIKEVPKLTDKIILQMMRDCCPSELCDVYEGEICEREKCDIDECDRYQLEQYKKSIYEQGRADLIKKFDESPYMIIHVNEYGEYQPCCYTLEDIAEELKERNDE